MRSGVVLLIGAVLNLCVAFAPLGLAAGDAAWSRPEHLVLAIGLTLLLLADAAERGAVNLRANTTADRRALRLAQVTGCAILTFVWCALWERSVATSPLSAWQIGGGSTLLILGAALRAAAVRQLGRQFVTEVSLEVRDRLVRSGIYAAVRHPSETGLLLALAGIALVLDSSWTALGAVPTFAALTWLRLRLEETELRAAFGDSYGAYCREVGAVWPKWR